MFPKNLKLRDFNWIFLSTLVISAVLYSAGTIPTCSADGTAKMFVEPPQSIFTTATVGTTFQVNASIANITGLAGLEFKLFWNASLLSCTNLTENLFTTVTPQDQTDNIWSIKKLINNTGGYIQYAYTFQNIEQATSGGYCPINITQTNYPPEGKLAVAIMNFNITRVPPTNSYYNCTFDFALPIKAGDVSANPISVTAVGGYYKIYGPPETLSQTVVKDSATYVVTTASNASVVPDSMTYIANYTLAFNLTGADGTTGYVNVTIPKGLVALANLTDNWNVTVNGVQVTPVVVENATHTFLYITASLSTKTVTIIGTIPEFPMLMVIPLFMVATLIAVGIRRRRRL
jgi:hypothetical protein